MSSPLRLAIVLCTLSAMAAPAAGARFSGLERLYFERVTDLERRYTSDPQTGERLPLPLPVRLELPPPTPPHAETSEQAPAAAPEPVPPETTEPGAEPPPAEEPLVLVTDFPIPAAEGEPALVLRQVIAWPESRIQELYWALYENGRRQDVWTFSPVHKRAQGKILPNHRLTGVSRRDGGRIVLAGVGEWDPAGGDYSERGERFLFRLERGELRFELALAQYGFFQTEKVVESPGAEIDYKLHYAAFVEKLVGGPDGERIERRSVADASPELIARCLAGGADGGGACVDCGEPSHSARCLAEATEAVVTYRRPDEPSFVEVGGKGDGGL